MNVNKNLIDFLTKTNNINGVSFAGIKGYQNSKGEIANVRINLGASLSNAKAKDLKKLKALCVNQFWVKLSDDLKETLTFDVLNKGYINVYNSLVKIGDKLYDGSIKVQNTRSKAQTNTYTIINSSVKIHNTYEKLYLYGLQVSKEIIVKGVYPIVNSRALTLAQNEIKKGMLHTKFRMYIIDMIDVMNISKSTFNGEDLNINLS